MLEFITSVEIPGCLADEFRVRGKKAVAFVTAVKRTHHGVLLAVVALVLAIGVVDAAPALAAAPTITSFTPTSAKLGATVTVTGTGFTSPATVAFNGVAASSSTVTSSTTIVTRVPYTATSGPLRVTTAGGTVTSSASFTVLPGVLLTKAFGPPTSALSVRFSEFGPSEAVDVYVDTSDVALASASTAGAGTVPVTIPAAATPGTHWITAVGRRSGISAQTTFLVRTDWAQYGFDGSRAGANPYEGTLGAGNVATLTQAWSAPVATQTVNTGQQQAVVAGGIVYLDTTSGVAAFSESTGAKLWSQTISGGVYTTPAVSGGLVLIGTATGHLMAFAATTGAIRYDFGFSGEAITRPIAVAGAMGFVQVQSSTGSATSVIGFDVANGAQDWAFNVATSCAGSVVAGGNVYLSCDDGHLRALRAADGVTQFDNASTVDVLQSPPVVANGLVYCAGLDQTNGTAALFAFDADTGSPEWTSDTTLDVNRFNSLVVDRGTVFLASNDTARNRIDVVTAFSAASGDVVWTHDVRTTVADPPVAANGLLYVPAASTTVLDETTGAVVTRVRGTAFDVVTDAGLVTAASTGQAILRLTLPGPASATVARPAPARLHYAARRTKVQRRPIEAFGRVGLPSVGRQPVGWQ